MKNANPKIDWFFKKDGKWQTELKELRTIVLSCPLSEEVKWGNPCYMFEDKNIVLMHKFKEYCALLFFKGSLLKDAKGILVQQTENVQAARQMRFTTLQEVAKRQASIKAYIREAIEVEKAGLKVDLKKTSEFKIPAEFQKKLEELPSLKAAFATLTPGRQRGYLLHFSGAKQAKTRESRIEKCMQPILDGKGLDD